ncbi:MAG: OadG family protein [Caldilineaceae bacterium]|nr:OadG family protein [Caldilineaceae bacterium]
MAKIGFTLEPLFHDTGIPLAIMGVLVVFLALAVLVIFIQRLPYIMERLEPRAPSSAAPAPPVVSATNELPEELVVVITAAVAAALDRPHRIVRIRGLTPTDMAWSMEGRSQHHQSHRIRPRGN